MQCALDNGWVEPNDHIVVVSRSHIDELMVKVGAAPAPAPAASAAMLLPWCCQQKPCAGALGLGGCWRWVGRWY